MAHDIDFFETDEQAAAPNPTMATNAQKDTKNPSAPVSRDWKAKIKSVHVLSLLGVLVMVWAVWPMLVDTGAPNVTARMPSAAPSMAVATHVQQEQGEQPAGNQKTILQENPAPKRENKNSPEQMTFSIEAALAELHDQQRSVQASQQELKASLQLLLTHVKQLSATKEALKVEKPVNATPSAMKTVPKKTAATKSAVSFPGLKVNTVYPGQAWIDAPEGKTYIVHVGDMLEGAQVLSIDDKARVVQTTHGAIR